eukprot:3662046-Alexandrium_andersonii.AAC.1
MQHPRYQSQDVLARRCAAPPAPHGGPPRRVPGQPRAACSLRLGNHSEETLVSDPSTAPPPHPPSPGELSGRRVH